MANARDIKRRIKSVRSTQQITKAMKMVSASKLRRSQSTVQSMRPYTRKLEDIILELSAASDHDFLHERPEIKKICYLVIGANRGLCGGFNGNLHRFLDNTLKKQEHPFELVVIGRKAADHCRRMNYNVVQQYDNIGDNPAFADAEDIASHLAHAFANKDYDEIHIVYSEFKSAMIQDLLDKRLLPVEQPEANRCGSSLTELDYIFEPDQEAILKVILPQYIDIGVYCALQNAKASEHGARMTAMSSATDNANDMISKLTLSLNRARQAAITTEISEIVGGAAALS